MTTELLPSKSDTDLGESKFVHLVYHKTDEKTFCGLKTKDMKKNLDGPLCIVCKEIAKERHGGITF